MTGRLTVERYEPSEHEQWDELACAARAPHFMFERSYMDYHADRFVDASLVVLIDGRPLAALPASRHGDQVVSHGGLTFGGLLAGAQLTTERTVQALEQIAAALRAQGARTLLYKPVPHIYHVMPAEEDLYALYVSGAQLIRRDASAAVAAGPRIRYASGRRWSITRARKAGVVVGEDRRIEEYMTLVAEMLREHHDTEPVHTPAEMRLLADRFPSNIRLFAATVDEEIVAGALVYETAAVAHTQYIAAGPRGRELGGNDAVIDHLLSDRYLDRWFDFGISNERSGELNAGLMRNKEGFGARAVAYDQYLLALR